MNIRTIATLAVAVLLGLVAVLLVRNYVGSARKSAVQTATAGPATAVVVAAVPVARGAVLLPAQLKVANYPADSVPPGSFQTVASLTGAGPNSRLALRALSPNEPILADKISPPGGKLTLSVTLADGMRAVSLHASDTADVAGFVLPGDRVDILLTRSIGGGDQANVVTQVLAENVLILAIDQSADDETNKPIVARVVTVEVDPNMAQTLTLAQSAGTVSLLLRHVADSAALTKKVTTVAQLGYFNAPKPPTAVALPGTPGYKTPKGMRSIRVTRGVDIQGYTVSMR